MPSTSHDGNVINHNCPSSFPKKSGNLPFSSIFLPFPSWAAGIIGHRICQLLKDVVQPDWDGDHQRLGPRGENMWKPLWRWSMILPAIIPHVSILWLCLLSLLSLIIIINYYHSYYMSVYFYIGTPLHSIQKNTCHWHLCLQGGLKSLETQMGKNVFYLAQVVRHHHCRRHQLLITVKTVQIVHDQH